MVFLTVNYVFMKFLKKPDEWAKEETKGGQDWKRDYQ